MKNSMFWTLMLMLGLVSGVPFANADAPVQAVRTHNQFSFMIDSTDAWGNTTYYNPDSVAERTQDVLQQLGATNVQAYVADADDLVMDPVVDVQFDSLRMATETAGTPLVANWKQVVFQGNDDGNLVGGILTGVRDHFDVRNFQSSDPSIGPSAPYRFALSTLFAQ